MKIQSSAVLALAALERANKVRKVETELSGVCQAFTPEALSRGLSAFTLQVVLDISSRWIKSG